MKHTDFYAAQKAIEELAKQELIDALKAIGGVFVPNYVEIDNRYDELVIAGAFKHAEGTEDILFTKAEIDEFDKLAIYGKPYRDQSVAEEQVVFLETGYIHFILDIISETNLVSDTRKEKRNKAAMQQVRAALNRSV